MIKNIIMKNRYFIVFYRANHAEIGAFLFGSVSIKTNGTFIGSKDILKQIEKSSKEIIWGVVITNIIEISEIDFNTWNND